MERLFGMRVTTRRGTAVKAMQSSLTKMLWAEETDAR
jgi:hypothetical protein